MAQHSLSKFETFGDVAAEDDAVLDYFLSTNAVQRIEKREAFLVLGRKGTGKTAIVRYLTEGNRPLSKALNLRGYPWNVDEARSKMLIGAILAARDIKRTGDRKYGAINPVVYLRTDLWDELQFSDKNKISQTLTFHLEWNSRSLLDLVETRLKARLAPKATWDDIIEEGLMRGSQSKWNHILARTFLRPRDVIRFLNTALERAKVRGGEPLVFTNEDIVASREDYSSYLKQELDDEIRPHWNFWDEALQACSAISTITFERKDFEREYARRQSVKNKVTADEALAFLHRFSVIGYERRSGYGGSSWAFQYADPEAGWDSAAGRFKVHLGLKEYAKLRESRESAGEE